MKSDPEINENRSGEALVLERVRLRLAKEYQKKGEKHRHIGGGLYRAAGVFYYILSVWFMLVMLVNLFIIKLSSERYTVNGNAEKAAFFKGNAVVVAVMLVLIIASFVLMIMKRKKASCLVCFAGMAALAIQFVQISFGSYISGSISLSVLYIPAVLLLPVTLTLYIIIKGDERREKKAYESELARIYRKFSSDGNVLMTDEKWREVIEEYESQNSK